MALINPCDVSVSSVSNTGVECSAALGVAKGVILVSANDKWTKAEMQDTATFIRNRIHAAGGSRFYPVLQGIFDQALATESDVTEQNPITRLISRLIPGGFTFTTTYEQGGLCLAQALLSFQGKSFRAIFVDQDSQFLLRKNSDGTYSGLKTSDISSSITPASPTAKFKNILVLGVSQDEYIRHSELFKSEDDITDFNGLIDTEIVADGTAIVGTGGTSATRTITITAVGSNGDTIDVGVSGGPVAKTGTETTVTLLAAKVVTAINANTTTTGYSAANTAGVITITASPSIGASVNGVNTAPVIVGTITETHTAYTGGVNGGSGKLLIGIQTECSNTDLVASYGADIAKAVLFKVVDKAEPSTPITITAATFVTDHIELTGAFIGGHTYTVTGTTPLIWLNNDIVGYDASQTGADITIPFA